MLAISGDTGDTQTQTCFYPLLGATSSPNKPWALISPILGYFHSVGNDFFPEMTEEPLGGTQVPK